jgi:phosphoglucomutase
MAEIRFGTSGWRAIISEDFTFENVRLVTQAISDFIKQTNKPTNQRATIVVGYDTRFLSKEFAKEAAGVLSSNGIKALLSDRDVPTPVISYHIIKERCAGGINFTASHNPPQYNGIKFSPKTGGPAEPEVTKIIEKNIARLKNKTPLSYRTDEKLIKIFNPQPPYIKQIEKFIDFKAIKRAGLKIALDCLYGTSRDYLDYLLKKHGCKPEALHNYLNPYFDGKRPEPAPENIPELISLVKRKRFELGLATDGDADRFGIIDSDGTYITPNQVIVLLFSHLLNTRKDAKKKVVARTVATTHMIDAVAKMHNIEVIETPVGFKYFVDIINSGSCIIAGEESGGLSMSGHLPEKDGILACLLIAEMVAIEKKSIRQILAGLYKRYGRFYTHRIDLALTEEKKKSLIEHLQSGKIREFGRLKITQRDLKDGIRFFLEDGSWALFRPSGTEPIVRCYFESSSQKTLAALIKAGKEI